MRVCFRVFCGYLRGRWRRNGDWGGGPFGGHEAAFFVRAVTEGAVFRLAAATEGDSGFVGGDGEGVASRVDDGEGAFDEEWTVIADFDRNLRHHGFLERPEPRAHGSLW